MCFYLDLPRLKEMGLFQFIDRLGWVTKLESEVRRRNVVSRLYSLGNRCQRYPRKFPYPQPVFISCIVRHPPTTAKSAVYSSPNLQGFKSMSIGSMTAKYGSYIWIYRSCNDLSEGDKHTLQDNMHRLLARQTGSGVS